ncbi:MAG: hypothetical protein M1838_005437 [Thelocarpon superellum]|nr:MAG: hypothetical protein M1838_005437 [Thelocarpon superellum]
MQIYPERLLIYHAGTGKIVFLGCLKLTTIFLFGFSCLVLAPSYYQAKGRLRWMAGLAPAVGLIPLLLITRITSPFVTYIHLRLPIFARRSHTALLRYVRTLDPASGTASAATELDFTTMRATGRSRVVRLRLPELRRRWGGADKSGAAEKARRSFAVANLVWVRPGLRDRPTRTRAWWRVGGGGSGRDTRYFYVEGNSGVGAREKGIWEVLCGKIRESP